MIRVEALRKSLSDVRAVDGIDLHVEQGELLVLLGQNGAGKSTTLRCMGGILRPDSGLIELDGLRLPERLDAIRGRLGVVPDQARLYGRNTAPEYLDHFGYLYGVPKAIRRKRIDGLLERFELADRKSTVLAAYSRGMAQKVELMADRIAVMRRGVIVTHGTLDELRREAGQGRRFIALLARPVQDPEPLSRWLREHAMDHSLEGDRLRYTLPWHAGAGDRADFA